MATVTTIVNFQDKMQISRERTVKIYGYSSLLCTLPHRHEKLHAVCNHIYLPPSRGDIPAFTPAEDGSRFSDPGGTQG